MITDGNWEAWSDWSFCSTSCGLGVETRSRQCDNSCTCKNRVMNTCDGQSTDVGHCYPFTCPRPTGWYMDNKFGSLQH